MGEVLHPRRVEMLRYLPRRAGADGPPSGGWRDGCSGGETLGAVSGVCDRCASTRRMRRRRGRPSGTDRVSITRAAGIKPDGAGARTGGQGSRWPIPCPSQTLTPGPAGGLSGMLRLQGRVPAAPGPGGRWGKLDASYLRSLPLEEALRELMRLPCIGPS